MPYTFVVPVLPKSKLCPAMSSLGLGQSTPKVAIDKSKSTAHGNMLSVLFGICLLSCLQSTQQSYQTDPGAPAQRGLGFQVKQNTSLMCLLLSAKGLCSAVLRPFLRHP